MWTQISGRMPASSQASSELSTASLTVVSSALRGLSNPSRCRFLAKNSLTEMSRCLAAIDSAVATAEAAVAADVHAGPVVDGAVDGAVYAPPGIHAHNYACLPRDYLHPHLFYNYFVGGNCGSIPAAMYPAPMPTPPIVGHTFFTYQPLLPHEFMYAHKRVYHHHYNYNRGLHRTRVVWAW
jgi:hypothetical protein